MGTTYFSNRNQKSDNSQHLSRAYYIPGDHNTQLILTRESTFVGTKTILSL